MHIRWQPSLIFATHASTLWHDYRWKGEAGSAGVSARIKFSGGKPKVIDGPFTEEKELIAGYWLIQVKSKEEAIEWAKRAPAPHGEAKEGEIELRQLYELEDFGPSEAIEKARELEKNLAKKR